MHLQAFRIVTCLAFFVALAVASMLEVFHGTSCDDTPKGVTQMLYASHAGYSFCGSAEDYGLNIVVRSGEEPDNPDWPYCEWTFFSDVRCQDLIATLNPEGHTCACAVLPVFQSFRIDCYGDPWKRRKRRQRKRQETISPTLNTGYALKSRNRIETVAMMNQSSTPAQVEENSCDRPIPTFRTGLTFANGQLQRNTATMMVDRFTVLETGDPEFVGNIFHAAHQEIYPIFTQLEKLWRNFKVVTVAGPMNVKIDFTIYAEPGYALGTAIEAINPERLPRVLYILFYTMRRQGMRAVKFRLTSVDGDGSDTPVMSMVVHVVSSVP